MADSPRQPLVHDLVACVAAPDLVLSGQDGQVRGGAHGFYAGDRRALCRLVVTVDGAEPEPLLWQQAGAGGARFVGVLRRGPAHADPSVVVERVRTARPARERLVVRNHGREALRLRVAVRLAADLADLTDVRAGAAPAALAATRHPDGLAWSGPGVRVRVTVTPPPDPEPAPEPAPEPDSEPAPEPDPEPDADRRGDGLRWSVDLDPGTDWTVDLAVRVVQDAVPPVVPVAPGTEPFARPEVDCADPRLGALLRRSLDDLAALALADPRAPGDAFLAAGSPWYLTLFGRDSLWAARMLLPLGTGLAAGTLRALARRQGRRYDDRTDEAPGKIPHELRHAGGPLPPLSYSTVDATPLFVCLLADAWRWGMPEAEVAALLPAALRALDCVRDGVERGGGFLRYRRARPGGLGNQGWKDSADAVQFADGSLADPPVALCEVQGYAYAAACAGADLLDAFDGAGHGIGRGVGRGGRSGGTGAEWRAWAAALRERFHRSFWLSGPDGPYVAVALDGRDRPVDAVASNMGHLPGTGILDAAQVVAVAARLAAPDLDGGWGLRTMSARSARFNPLGYHTGSVWPHDTAIAAAGLAAHGCHGAAGALARGLLAAGARLDHRLPELYGGEQRRPGFPPLPYPTACRPQAWSAAAAVAVLAALVGLRPDVPDGRVTVAPVRPSPVGALRVRGLRVGGGTLAVRVDADGVAAVEQAPSGLRVEVR